MTTTLIDRWSRTLLAIAALAALLVAVSGPGHRLGLPLAVSFGLFRWGGYIAIVVTVLTLAAFVTNYKSHATRTTTIVLAMALALGVGAAFAPLRMLWQSRSVPPIHDITTDAVRPPEYVDIVRLRAGVRNPLEYGGGNVYTQQLETYPLIKTQKSSDPPERQFPRALAAVREMGWHIVAVVPAEGRIEATDTTPFFGFTDDIVIRVTADGAGSKTDVRSLSRVGKSDLGANARRVEAYLWRLGLLGP